MSAEAYDSAGSLPFWKRAIPAKVMFLVLFVASVLHLWLVSAQHMSFVGNSWLDDRLFVNLAQCLVRGQYLGQYNNTTLAKGLFFPVYLAFVHVTHIPLMISEHVLYVVACLIFLVCAWPLMKVRQGSKGSGYVPYIITTALGLLLIFNPITSDASPGTRVIREGIYPALTLFTVSFFVALVAYRGARMWKYVLVTVGAGLSLSALWLTREEGIWVVPFVLGVVVLVIVMAIREWYRTLDSCNLPPPDRPRRHFLMRIAILIIPFIILWLSILAVSTLNYRRYGVQSTVEFKAPQFVAAYSALTRVKADDWMPEVPVPAANRKLIYEVSPSFRELKPYLEGYIGRIWGNTSSRFYPQYKGEMAGGWFIWAFRDAVEAAGHYKSGREAMDFYAKLAKEVNTACTEGKLPCVDSTDNLYPPLDSRYVRPFIRTLGQAGRWLVTFKDYSPIPYDISGDESDLAAFSSVTREPATNRYGNTRVTILEVIGRGYQVVFPILTVLAVVSFVLLLFLKWSYKEPLFVITGLIGITIVVRLALLSVIQITSCPSINNSYLSCAYPLLIIFDVFSVFLVYKRVTDAQKGHHA